jgi:uncharacterized protein (TIGR00369 family)
MSRQLKWNAEEIYAFLTVEFPQAFDDPGKYVIEALDETSVSVRRRTDAAHLRPGGTVSGPTLMELVDVTAYFLLLALHAEAASLCVTSNLQISFLRKPQAGDLVCRAELLKHGRVLSVIDCRITSGNGRLVAHAQTTYHMSPDIAWD